MINEPKLRGRIVEKFGTISNFASAYGISKQQMSAKITGKVSFTTKDIDKMTRPEFLDIQQTEIGSYFFVR